MKRWYVAHTHVRAEAKAHMNLERQGFSAYLPRFIKTRRHARRIERFVAPLFPRYVFVEADLMRDQWRCLYSTIGVRHVVSRGGEPAPVPDEAIAEIRNREDKDGYVALGSGVPFRRGDSVRIVDGAFVDMVGLFDSVSEQERVFVLLSLLGRQVRVALPLHALSACG